MLADRGLQAGGEAVHPAEQARRGQRSVGVLDETLLMQAVERSLA